MTRRDRSRAAGSGPAGIGNGFDPGGEPCAPCVAQLHSPAERLAALREAVHHEPDPLVTLTHLLHLCRDEHRVLWAQAGSPGIRATVANVLAPLRTVVGSGPAAATLDAPVRQALAEALRPVDGAAPVVIAHALAQFLDDHYRQCVTESFRRRSPYQPGVGDPVPLGGPDIRAVMDMRPTSPPWRLANRLDETRRVRLAGGWVTQFRIVFDYSLFDALPGLVTADTIVATCHPNRALTEFTLPRDSTQPTFPVQPTDLDRQRRHLDQLIGRAAAAGASIIVLPELCVTESLARHLQDWVRREDGPRLLVAGSYHHVDGSPPRRRNTAIAWVRGHDQPLTHDKHSPAEQPILEDIQPQGWPELRVYVTADGWHLVIAICRDLLNPEAVHTLAETGANLVLVPAMSESLAPFTGQVAHLVGSGQAIIALANNPADWARSGDPAPHRSARALFGHPGLGQQTRVVASPDTAPGIATLNVRSGLIGWTSADSQDSPGDPPGDQPSSSQTLPEWAARLAAAIRRYRQYEPPPPKPITLRPAAVLVLLTDGPTGPQILLTTRAPDLRDYPGRRVFPGGVRDPQDDGPVATALREAGEEIGLDPGSVQILGVLPALAEPETRFLVTPVLGWSARPEYTRPVNLAEVTSVHDVPLRQLTHPGHDRDGVPDPPSPELTGLGSMTAMVIDMLLTLLAEPIHPSGSGHDRASAKDPDAPGPPW
ncbi:NUDIX domain-containing protein (plasmid) [Rhodococcus pseudokoreensis]|uniref:NUDIX domain-containing protein n=1 Tax=Rhodococcus pseudokoreensis TaxID=2811421 RepID=A0A974VY36_9NOCA|nr:NUDIX domain-containing protein [Rhodococcus opacus]QSE87740.1 NUDIX domain-containing protein [Rhodococcus pseudokoreensis]